MVQPTRRRLLAATAGLAGGLAGCSAGRRESPSTVDAGAENESGDDSESPGDDRGSAYTEVYEAAIDSVTFVRSQQGSGSGFVYGDYVITNQHVAGDADEMDVRFENGDWREAGVLATDAYADLAVLSADIPEIGRAHV